MSVIDHAERYLGPIDKGWKNNSSKVGLQVVSFNDTPGESVTTFLTLGLSHHVLEVSNTKKIRQELVCAVSATVLSNLIVSFLLLLGESILKNHKALLRGEVIFLSNEVARKVGFDAVYCSIPVFIDDDFATYHESDPATVIVWMIPIYESEADFIAGNGWDRFEDLLEEKDPDFYSLDREPVI